MTEFSPQNLFEVISALKLNREFSEPIESKVDGPSCRLDKETFDLLARDYKHRQYSLGVMTGFLNVKDIITPGDLKIVSRAVQKAKKNSGKHAMKISLFSNEMDALNKVAEASELKPAAVLEATAYLYFRAIDRVGQSLPPIDEIESADARSSYQHPD